MRSLLLVGLVVPSLAFGFYSPKVARWTTPDPIEEEGGKNLYAFCENDPVNKFDPNGCAYFAKRALGHSPVMIKWSSFVTCPFLKLPVDHMADKLNIELVHEQLFFEVWCKCKTERRGK